MIKPSDYKSYWNHALEEIDGLKASFIVATEAGLSKKIKDISSDQLPFLVAVLPSADPKSPDVDNQVEENQTIIFVLTKREPLTVQMINLLKIWTALSRL